MGIGCGFYNLAVDALASSALPLFIPDQEDACINMDWAPQVDIVGVDIARWARGVDGATQRINREKHGRIRMRALRRRRHPPPKRPKPNRRGVGIVTTLTVSEA